MRTLDRKLFRELAASKGQSLAIGLVVASGVAVFVMSLGTLSFLRSTRDAYYERYRFAEVFAAVRRAPVAAAERLAQIPGVNRVQTRIVFDVTLGVPRLDEPAVGRLISIPDQGQPALNNVFIRRGRLPRPELAGEVLVNEVFAEANDLSLGDSVQAILNGRSQELQIVGIGLSPEYVFQIRGGDILPDERRFGVFWMRRRQMEAAFDMDGAFNNVTLSLMRGTDSRPVLDRVDRVLAEYGGVGAYDRSDQLSARFLADEIKQLRATAFVSPAIFLGVAAFLLNVVLTRRIQTQREIIATLKAFGYSDVEVAWHYLKQALLVALVGALLGVLLGRWMGSGMAELYSQFYRFPESVYRSDPRIVITGVTISLLAASVGVLRAVFSVARLAPAEAMRPASPGIYRRSSIETLALLRSLPVASRMVVRQLQRKPVHASLSVMGIAFSVSILVMGSFLSDAFDFLIDFQFYRLQRHDVQVALYEAAGPQAGFELEQLPGVGQVERYRAVPVRLLHGHHQYRTSIMGLDQDRQLYRLLNAEGDRIELPEEGLVLGDKLAERLEAEPGDAITVELLDGPRTTRPILLASTTKEFAGMHAYMRRPALNRLMEETDAISGVYLSVDEKYQDELYQVLKRTPRVASVSVKEAMIDQFRATVTQNQTTMQGFTVFFAVVIAVGVIYNTARVSLEERSRELATMRVIGFTRAEVSSILLGELAVLTLAAIPLGFLIGYGFCLAMVKGFESEAFRIPVVISSESYATSALVTLAAAAGSGLLVRRRIDRLDLVEVLKTRE